MSELLNSGSAEETLLYKLKNLKQETECQNPNDYLNLVISTIKQSVFFQREMNKAFQHGIKFELKENKKDLCIETTEDKDLPFNEWFNKHYRNQTFTHNVLGTDKTSETK